jgi:hypothetical protein
MHNCILISYPVLAERREWYMMNWPLSGPDLNLIKPSFSKMSSINKKLK